MVKSFNNDKYPKNEFKEPKSSINIRSTERESNSIMNIGDNLTFYFEY